MSTIYHAYAPFYDGSGQIRFAVLMAHYLDELLQHHPVNGRRSLDLACGTGTLALLLADKGWHVVGVDQSEPMLALARDKATALVAAGTASFVQGDIRSFASVVPCSLSVVRGQQPIVPTDSVSAFGSNNEQPTTDNKQFDLATCTYDSLNYLLNEADLAACFAQVAAALVPGGLFVADMNTRHFLEHDWDAASVVEGRGMIEVQQSYFDPATECSTLLLSGFVGDDDHGYARFDETHIERAYSPDTVARLLDGASLRVEAAYDCFTLLPHYERSQRIAWIARKQD